MRFLVVSPPVSEPSMPLLGPIVLRQAIRDLGHQAEFVDLNLEFHELFLNQALSKPETDEPLQSWVRDLVEPERTWARDRITGTVPGSASEVFRAVKVISAAYRVLSYASQPWAVTMNELRGPGNVGDPSFLLASIDDPANPAVRHVTQRAASLVKGHDAILISVSYQSQIIPALALARSIIKLRDRPDRTPFVAVGGALISIWGRRLLAFPDIVNLADLFGVGHGEPAVEGIVQHLQGQIPKERIPNAITATNGHVGLSAVMNLPPGRNRETIDMSDLPGPYWVPSPIYPVMWGRSCYWRKCAFCGVHSNEGFDGPAHYGVDIDAVHRQLQHIRALGVSRVMFTSESLHPEDLLELRHRVSSSPVDVTWIGRLRPEPAFGGEPIRAMRELGCEGVAIGFESAVDRVLHLMNKGVSASGFKPLLSDLADHNIEVTSHFMVGFPGETKEEAIQTLSFIEDNKDLVGYPVLSVFRVHSVSPVASDPARYGVELGPDAGLDIMLPHSSSRGMTVPQASDVAREASRMVRRVFGDPLLLTPMLGVGVQPRRQDGLDAASVVRLVPDVVGLTRTPDGYRGWGTEGPARGSDSVMINRATFKQVGVTGWGLELVALASRPRSVSELVSACCDTTGVSSPACLNMVQLLWREGFLEELNEEGST